MTIEEAVSVGIYAGMGFGLAIGAGIWAAWRLLDLAVGLVAVAVVWLREGRS